MIRAAAALLVVRLFVAAQGFFAEHRAIYVDGKTIRRFAR